jgi:hypothetical protein
MYPALTGATGDIDGGDDAVTLPTFVVIGAMKAGTVSLRHYLGEHPCVFMGGGGTFGEPNFFVAEDNWPRGREWYESLFDGAGRERRRAEVALLDDRYLGPSRYGFQLAAFLDHFDRSQVLVVASEVLRDSPREALNAVFYHLGVDPAADDPGKQHQDHRSIDKPVPRLHDLGWLPRRQVKLRPRWRPDQRTGPARLLTTRRARPADSAIPPELRDQLAGRLAPDLRHFERLLGHRIPSYWRWTTSVPA